MTPPILFPEWRTTLNQGLIIFLSIGVFLWLLNSLSPILMPFIAAFIIAYILNPGVLWLQNKKINRNIAVLLMLLLLITVVSVIGILIFSVLQREIPQLKDQVPALLKKLNAVVAPKLYEFGIRVRFDFPGLRKMVAEQVAGSPEDVMNNLLDTIRFSSNAAISIIGNLLFIPLVVYYLLIDWNSLLNRVARIIPRKWWSKTEHMLMEADELLSQYLRGQFLVMIVLAVYYAVTLSIARFEVALPVGIVTGLAIFIPYVGFGLGLALALLAALLQFGNTYGLLAVALIYGGGQLLESFFLTPRMVGERIGMHPLGVIFALLAFGQLFGFFGILLALPASALTLVVLRELNRVYLSSRFYQG